MEFYLVRKQLVLFRSQMISQHEAEMKELKDVLYTMDLRYRERETEAEQEFQGMMDELKNKVSTNQPIPPLLVYGLCNYQSIALGGYTCPEGTLPGNAGQTMGRVSGTDSELSQGNGRKEDQI